jgi:mRNA-degrading endonuclease RelE of RelBE toxin-antitoxin system
MALVTMTAEAAGQFAACPRRQATYDATLERLSNWPNVSGVKRLSGDLANHCRLRTGDYRMQFRVEGERVIVEKIGHRDGFYED